jgi:hypothetical protein
MKPLVEKRALTITTPLLAAYSSALPNAGTGRVVNRLRAALTLNGPRPRMSHTVRLGFTNCSRKDIKASA